METQILADIAQLQAAGFPRWEIYDWLLDTCTSIQRPDLFALFAEEVLNHA